MTSQRAGNQTDALLIYERSMQRYPLSTRLCNGFALLLQEVGKSQQSAHLLAQSVLQFLQVRRYTRGRYLLIDSYYTNSSFDAISRQT
jgi:hypothetical protein